MILIGAMIVVPLVLCIVALWAELSGGSSPLLAAPATGTERIIERAEARRDESARTAEHLKQKQLGENYQIDAEGNLLTGTADMTGMPVNRPLRQPTTPTAPLDDISRNIRRPELGEVPAAPPARDPDSAEAKRPETMLGYSTVRGANWAGRNVDLNATRSRHGAEGDDSEAPRGEPAPKGSDAEDRMIRIMEDAARSQGPGQGQGALATAAGQMGLAPGPSGRGDALYPASNEAQAVQAGSVADMRIGGGRGPDQIIRQGKFLDCALVNHLRVDLTESEVLAMVTRDFVSIDGKYVLIPAGAKLLGSAGTVQNVQQSRVYIRFDRIIFPDQRSAYFPVRRVGAVDGAGSVGIEGDVDRHLMLQFGSAVMLGILDGLAAAVQRPNSFAQPSGRDLILGRTSSNMSNVVSGIIARYGNVVPTISVEPGSSMKIFFGEDVRVSPYMESSELSHVRNGLR